MNEAAVVLVRTLIAFGTLLIVTRLLGKQQVSELTYWDYISGITLGNLAGSLASDLSSRALPHWVALLVWVGATLGLQWATLRSRWLGKYVDGEPLVVIMNGKIMEKAMSQARYRAAELLQQLRTKGYFDLGQVEFAVLETNGKLSVLPKSQHRPVTPQDLQIPTPYEGLGTELIYDGVIIDQNLEAIGRDRLWLEGELKKQGIMDPSEVFYAQLDASGALYVDRQRDRPMTVVDPSDYPGPN
ncbi:MAG TPA: DUF421 domain-containing protein [Limnochordia bacterium]